MDDVIEGRIGHYVAYNGRHLAAIVIGISDKQHGTVNLIVFTDMENTNGIVNYGIQFHREVEYSDAAFPGTWHFVLKCGNL